MSRRRDELIAELAADATPVARPGRTAGMAVLWLSASAVLSTGALIALGPFRAGAFQQLLHSPQFMLESLAGAAAIVALGLAACRSGIPASRRSLLRSASLPISLLALWVAFYVFGLYHPALPPSMLGKRDDCWLETLICGLPGLLLGLFWVRRLWPVHQRGTGALLGLAAGAIPAWLMQFACMYAPAHILMFHILPGLGLGVIGALGGALALRRR